MSVMTPHRSWIIKPGTAMGVSGGLLGAMISSYGLIGDPAAGPYSSADTEEFELVFTSCGMGAEIGLTLPAHLGRAVNSMVSESGAPKPILFYGPTRFAQSFTGFGDIIEISLPVFLTTTIQVLVFNVSIAPYALGAACVEFAWRWIQERTFDRTIHRYSPAVGLAVSRYNIGVSAGAMLYPGRWWLRAPSDFTGRGREVIGHNF